MNLQVLPYSINSLNKFKNHSKVSFGEIDGDFYSSSSRMSKTDYENKKNLINEKYDRKRSSWLQDADDLDIPSTEVWKQLNDIEEMRRLELKELETEY